MHACIDLIVVYYFVLRFLFDCGRQFNRSRRKKQYYWTKCEPWNLFCFS